MLIAAKQNFFVVCPPAPPCYSSAVGNPSFQLESLEERQFLSADHAGNTLARARNIGTLSSTAHFSDYVGIGDTTDYYKFKITGLKEVNISLNGSSSRVRLPLIPDFNHN